MIKYVYRGEVYTPLELVNLVREAENSPAEFEQHTIGLDAYEGEPAERIDTERWLDLMADELGIDRDDDYSFSADEFPRVL